MNNIKNIANLLDTKYNLISKASREDDISKIFSTYENTTEVLNAIITSLDSYLESLTKDFGDNIEAIELTTKQITLMQKALTSIANEIYSLDEANGAF